MQKIHSVHITGSGSYIPETRVSNEEFAHHTFYDTDGSPIQQKPEIIARKFKAITGIQERRYVTSDLTASDIGAIAAQRAIDDAGINPEELDYIVVAHNFGDVKEGTLQNDILPCLASRIKQQLKIRNPRCVAYDLLFGCPGWVEGVIQCTSFIQSGMADKCLVIGTETLSKVLDPHDRDSMIFADGAAATILESGDDHESGILGHASASHTYDEAGYLYYGPSNNPELSRHENYIKMKGRKIYEFALNEVPNAMKDCLDHSGVGIDQIAKVLIHQANEKMDEAIIERFYELYDMEAPAHIMPMSIHLLGNSSVATVPTLYDLLIKGKIDGHSIQKGEYILMASVGAGMHINAITYCL
jgi:3-oxoacyl-[acyl-carrier-protein] synthase-3